MSTASRRFIPLKMALRDKSQVFAAYMPAFEFGGIFVPSTRDWKLGEDIMLTLTLPEAPEPHTLMAKVGWVTPENAANNRKQGVGVAFLDDAACHTVRQSIEELLGSALNSERHNLTL